MCFGEGWRPDWPQGSGKLNSSSIRRTAPSLRCEDGNMRPSRHAFEQHRAAVRGRLLEAGAAASGPASVSWKINREVIVVAGWGRAILLQFAHPLVAAGINAIHDRVEGRLGESAGPWPAGTAYSAHDSELLRWVNHHAARPLHGRHDGWWPHRRDGGEPHAGPRRAVSAPVAHPPMDLGDPRGTILGERAPTHLEAP